MRDLGRLAPIVGVLAAAMAACTSPQARTETDGGTPGGDAPLPDARTDGAAPDATPPDAPAPDAPTITGRALQLNDVSILFPLPASATERETGLLLASSAGPLDELLPSTVFDGVGGLQALGSLIPRVDLRVVSLRIDPCFAAQAPDLAGGGCEAQLRLVLQPIAMYPNDDGRYIAFDAAVHTFYRLNRAQVFAFVEALVDLRMANSNGEHLGRLAPHPLMVSQGLAGDYAAGVRSLILGVAGSNNLTRVATFSSQTSAFWTFQIFDIGPSPASPATAREIATLPPGTTHQSLTVFGPAPPLVGFDPAPTSPDHFNDLANTNSAVNLSPATRLVQFDGLVRTENPKFTTPNTVACASCHVAMLVKKEVAEAQFGLQDSTRSDVFRPAQQFVPLSDMHPSFSTTTSDINLHAFSYLGDAPGISQRTVNESAAIVEYMNLATP